MQIGRRVPRATVLVQRRASFDELARAGGGSSADR